MEQAGGFSNKRFNSWIGLGLLAVALPLQAQPALSPAPELATQIPTRIQTAMPATLPTKNS